MKNKLLISTAISSVIIIGYYLFIYFALESKKDTNQIAIPIQRVASENHANSERALGEIYQNTTDENLDIEKQYPRSSMVSWLTDDDVKKSEIDIHKIEDKIFPGGDIPFPLNVKSSDSRIKNRFHAASLVLTFRSFERGYEPTYGYETNRYYLFFYGKLNNDNDKVEWERGNTLSKEHPYFMSDWDFRFEKKVPTGQSIGS